MMDDLDADLGHLFDAARRATDPTSADRSRIRAALTAKLASGVLLTAASANAAAGGGGILGKGLKLVLLKQVGPGLLAGALLGGGTSLMASAASDRTTTPTDTAVNPARFSAELRGPSVKLPPVTNVSSPADVPRDSVATPRAGSSTRAVGNPAPPASQRPSSAESAIAAFSEPTQTETSELSDELTIVSRIQQAWQRGDVAGVRRAVETHEQRFPRGTLTEEREAVKVMLACRSAEPGRATGLGSAFLSRYPGSTHAARVSAICGVKR
jgi:hypothetical protein